MSMTSSRRGAEPSAVLDDLWRLRTAVGAEAEQILARWRGDARRPLGAGAPNLAAYLALRRHDLRGLQRSLVDLGLASLGVTESHVVASLDAVLGGLSRMAGGSHPLGGVGAATDFAHRELDRHTTALFGFPLADRHTRIMVTLDGRDVDAPDHIEALVANGMDCARINCGHDDPEVWAALAAHVRAAAQATGRSCTVLMDLSGPRLRVGPIEPGAPVVKARVVRDTWGGVVEPAVVILDGTGAPGRTGGRGLDGSRLPTRIAVDPAWLGQLERGGRIDLVDGGGRDRTLEVVARTAPSEVECHVSAGCYLAEGTVLHYRPPETRRTDAEREPEPRRGRRTTTIGPIDAGPASIRVRVGDHLLLVRDGSPGRPERRSAGGAVEIASICCEDPAVVDDLVVGHRVLIDEGSIESADAVRNLPELLARGSATHPFAIMLARGDLAIEIGYERLGEAQEEILSLAEATYVPVVWATQVLERLTKSGQPTRAEITDAVAADQAECVMLNKGEFQLDALRLLHDLLRRVHPHHAKRTHLLPELHLDR